VAVFFSPGGNPEIWDEKPDGYFTPSEWWAAHPPVIPEPDPEAERLARIAEIKAELDSLDRRGERSAQSIALAVALGESPDAADIEAAQNISDRKDELRAELAEL
jgi:hypothetical protein